MRDGLFTYALGPGRGERLAELRPADAAAKQAQADAHAGALKMRLKQIDTAQDSLELGRLSTDPADQAAHAMRARIHTLISRTCTPNTRPSTGSSRTWPATPVTATTPICWTSYPSWPDG